MKRVFAFSLVGLSVPFLVWAQVVPVASPQALTAGRIREILTDIANFLIAVGIVGAVITIVTAGIIYFFHGFSANAVTKAKGVFKNALIGTLLVLGVGVIINTVGVLITGEFFGLGAPAPGDEPVGPCIKSSECEQGQKCSTRTTVDDKGRVITSGTCVRPTGNLEGEACASNFDCADGLTCPVLPEAGLVLSKCKKKP